MEASQHTVPPGAELALYELWRPIIRPRRRITLERLHQNIGEDFSSVLRDFLSRGEPLEFMGLRFESFQQLADNGSGECQTAAFAIEKTDIVGFLLLNDEQGRTLVDNRLGMGRAAPPNDGPVKFSRIESAILRDAINLMLVRLGAAYAAAGLGQLVVTRQSERLKDTLVFSPQDYLAIFRFRIGAAPHPAAVTIALSSNVINAVRDTAGGDHASADSKRLREAASELPMEVDVVLGGWLASPNELAALRVGERLILPDGEDAWLQAGGIRLRKVRARFDGPESIVDIKEERHPASLPAQYKGARIFVEAVLARLNVPAGAFSSFDINSEIEIEPDVGFAPMVRLIAGGTTVATATIALEADQLVATISQLGREPSGRKDDRWLSRKKV